MKIKKALLSISMIILMVAITIMPTIVFAADSLFLGILETNPDTNWGYSIGEPKTNGTSGNAHKIWNILEYMSDDESAGLKANGNKNIYCVNAGVGFSDTNRRKKYNLPYDMKTERQKMETEGNNVIKALLKGTIPGNDSNTTVSRYDALLALGDILYLMEDSEEQKMELLEASGTRYSEDEQVYYNVEDNSYTWNTLLTSDDIRAVQQAAIWYFTNYYEEDTTSTTYAETTTHNSKYDKTNSKSWLYYTTDGTTYKSLSDYNLTTKEGLDRQEQAEILYNYLIKTAKENASKYSNLTTTSDVPAQVNTAVLNYVELDSNYIVGPINFTEVSSNYNIVPVVKVNGTATENYKLLKSDKTEVPAGTKIKDLVEKDFYIAVPKESTTSITVSINITYSNTSLTLWTATSGGDSTQPVMIPQKDTDSVLWEKTVTPNTKPFDLALRKYITKINEVEVANSRVPIIDESTISSATSTATYKHRKDPVAVDVGDIVTYKITIYNEGDKAGRATKVVDQLPTGLEFIEVVSGDYKALYDDEKNIVNFTKESQNNLPAFTEGYLTSSDKGFESIEIKCKVVATAEEAKSKILTNVAWIVEEVDIDGNVITDKKGLDRDSEPKTEPKATDGNLVNKDNIEDYKGNNTNKGILHDKDYYYQGQQDDDDFEKLILSFDLKLIKRITAVNNQNVIDRIKSVDVSKLNTWSENGEYTTTADYKLDKDPVSVKKGDIVTYTFRIYNEGTMDGYASKITEDIPEGLKFLYSDALTDEEIDTDSTLTEAEKEAIKFNRNYYWMYEDATLGKISSDYLSKENETTEQKNLIKSFGSNDGTKTEKDISYKEISVKLKVISENVTGTIIRNEACIAEDTDKNGDPARDRDSDTQEWKKEDSNKYYDEDRKWPIYKEDEEDYDNIILKAFDLSLRKFIIAVSDDTEIENDEYLKDGNRYTRAPNVDTSKLNTKDENGKLITTAIYNHTKVPVEVKKNDIVVYMLRVYNEGEIDGYAAEIKDHLPAHLEFVEGEFNKKYGWKVSEDGRTATTDYLKDEKIKAAEEIQNNGEQKYKLTYREVPIMCKVRNSAITDEKITNIADITKYLDENKQSVNDRDSQEDNVVLPEDDKLPTYKDDETGEYIPGQQDDDDFEKVIIKRFDLALRKFITKIEDKDVTTRIPEVKYEDGKITYKHDKTPMQVVTNNIVTYTIRVFNEGEVDGYAKEITDDIPTGLEFLPDNELNKKMRWKMIDSEGKETKDVSKAVKITTDYLSKEQEVKEYNNLLKAFDSNKEISETNPDYKDVQVAFKVTEPNSSDKIIINSAQISDDSDKYGKEVDDDDSIPNEWNEGEDDQDREYIKLVEFDLALRKWVTQAIVIDSNGQTITETGHKPYDDPEQVVKVELHRKKLNQVTVKFRYSIRVINEGDIAGYVKEITDYVPQGLKFIAEDNKEWTDEGNNVISTKLLENTLLQPGEYADVEVVLTWINSKDNMGVMVNIAEISEDDNDYDVPDRDSTPDNKEKGEDDIDDAPVMLTVSTGQIRIYFTLGFIVLITIAGGVVLIKKYVL